MANLPSAKKRNKQNERNRVRNRARKSVLKTETRKFLDLVHDGNVDGAQEQLVLITRKLDQVAARGTLHKNTVARRKSRLARQVNSLRAKQQPSG